VQFGWSQEKFAENAGVHPTYVSAIESGKVSVGIKVANKLAKALDMRLSALIRMAE
jgi:transcriptional regulator with XRE-family HTH domain